MQDDFIKRYRGNRMKKLDEYVRTVPDFPEQGVMFRDITSVLQDPDGLHMAINEMQDLVKDIDFDVVVGAESRGFIFGTAIAYNLHKGFVMVRKKGKLPWDTIEESYDLEYGKAVVEMHKDSIDENDVVLIHDDLLATGGTLLASYQLVKTFNPKQIMINCIIELTNFKAKEKFPKDCPVDSFIAIDEFDGIQ
jgi:adenine phosphoribosyltransferase